MLANGKEVDSKVVSNAGRWEYSFTKLPEFKNGKKIQYTISEEKVINYRTEIIGYDLINTYTSSLSKDPRDSRKYNKLAEPISSTEKKLPKTGDGNVDIIMMILGSGILVVLLFVITIRTKRFL